MFFLSGKNFQDNYCEFLHVLFISLSYSGREGNEKEENYRRSEVMIEIKNLVKKYGNHIALDHVSFSIEKGKIYGLLGANGAGKSTTMNIITGYIGATSGSVEIWCASRQ
ncbi:hypothetical protein RT43_GL001328 [Enterococcus italicus DSM 15952]|nr:hypothetical protein RT43_GL001328 [Enterococcus italicus DSM 15952]